MWGETMKPKHERELLSSIRNAGGRFRLTHQAVHDGRKMTVAYLKVGDAYYCGQAQCSKKDRFSKKIGRQIALGRALKAYDYDHECPINAVPIPFRQKEDVVKE